MSEQATALPLAQRRTIGVSVPSRRPSVWKRLTANRVAGVAVLVLAVLVALALFAPVLFDERRVTAQSLTRTFAPPSADAWFGRDEFGRDAFVRAVYGARISLFVGLVSAVIATTMGAIMGLLAGYCGGIVDAVIDRFTELVLTVPFLVLLILAASLFRPSVTSIILILGLFDWPVVARLVRGEFLALKGRDFVQAAHAMGAGDTRIVLRHILPNAVAPLIVSGTLLVAGHITAEAAISFLGLGIQPPTPTWGNMLTQAQRYVISAPFLAVFPGVLILATVLCVNVIGDALRDTLDPRRQR